jgi:hypothetical protein
MAFVRSAHVPVASEKGAFVFDLPAELLPKPGGQKNCLGLGDLSLPGLEFFSFSEGAVMAHEIDLSAKHPYQPRMGWAR